MEPLHISQSEIAGTVRALRPTPQDRERVRGAVADIVDMVRVGGDEAVRKLTLRLDEIDVPDARVSRRRLQSALVDTPSDVRHALRLLAANLRATATEMMPHETSRLLPAGQSVHTRVVPVDRAGIYVPGGLAAYPSSAVMAIVPAQVAGVAQLAVCSPPRPDGLPDRTVLAACALLGVDEVYSIGGAQAVAALALGTETIRPVDMLVGPGNAYVEEAKRGLFGEVGIESLAGPSELVVLADESASPDAIAWDLMAQAEHGPGATAILVSTSLDVLEAVAAELTEPRGVTAIEVDSWETAFALVNAYAPEHLQLALADPRGVLDQVRHAGAIFLGASSGTAFGDYIAGSNHILPTGGRSRFSSGLTPAAFVRRQELVEVPPEAAAELAGPLAALARAEGLVAHARSAEIRAHQTSPAKGAAP